MSKIVLEVLEKSGSTGLSLLEIKYETKLSLNVIKKSLTRLRQKGKIYRNIVEARWRLIKYRTEDEKDYNERMKWCAG